jgi:hypothetical protein
MIHRGYTGPGTTAASLHDPADPNAGKSLILSWPDDTRVYPADRSITLLSQDHSSPWLLRCIPRTGCQSTWSEHKVCAGCTSRNVTPSSVTVPPDQTQVRQCSMSGNHRHAVSKHRAEAWNAEPLEQVIGMQVQISAVRVTNQSLLTAGIEMDGHRESRPMHFLPNFGPWIADPAVWRRQIYIPVAYSRRVADVL